MSTVLEKAVLLDETGQLIVNKLDDIKEAIGNSGEYIPLAIRVTTPPTKVSYYDGDALDLSGIVVSLVGSNGSLIDVTSACIFSPADGATLSTSDTSVAITYHYAPDNVDFTTTQNITVGVVIPVSIAVTTPPTKTEYVVGDTLDLTGMVVTATYNNGTTSDVTASCTFSPANGTTLFSDAVDTVNISYSSGGSILTAIQSIIVSNPIYGAEWDGTATTTWTRTDRATDFQDPSPAINNGSGSSPFDDIYPWSEIKRVTDQNAGELVEIPKFYYKWTRDGLKMKLQISESRFEGALTSPAHADRGDGSGERDVVYVGRYHCDSNYKSTSGAYPAGGSRRSGFRSSIHGLGSNIWQYDFAMWWTIAMLYLVEFADWNSQEKIGYGCSPSASYFVTGRTDSMNYHTGTTASSRQTYGATQYRYIEGLWDNFLTFCDGVYFSSDNVYCIKNPSNFSDTTGGTLIGALAPSNGTTKKWLDPSNINGYEYALYPSEVTTSESANTYSCDRGGYSPTGIVLRGGGMFLQSQSWGLFHLDCYPNDTHQYTGSRLMKLP